MCPKGKAQREGPTVDSSRGNRIRIVGFVLLANFFEHIDKARAEIEHDGETQLALRRIVGKSLSHT
jgi:hypothetical protein